MFWRRYEDPGNLQQKNIRSVLKQLRICKTSLNAKAAKSPTVVSLREMILPVHSQFLKYSSSKTSINNNNNNLSSSTIFYFIYITNYLAPLHNKSYLLTLIIKCRSSPNSSDSLSLHGGQSTSLTGWVDFFKKHGTTTTTNSFPVVPWWVATLKSAC